MQQSIYIIYIYMYIYIYTYIDDTSMYIDYTATAKNIETIFDTNLAGLYFSMFFFGDTISMCI